MVGFTLTEGVLFKVVIGWIDDSIRVLFKVVIGWIDADQDRVKLYTGLYSVCFQDLFVIQLTLQALPVQLDPTNLFSHSRTYLQ